MVVTSKSILADPRVLLKAGTTMSSSPISHLASMNQIVLVHGLEFTPEYHIYCDRIIVLDEEMKHDLYYLLMMFCSKKINWRMDNAVEHMCHIPWIYTRKSRWEAQ